jgi:hypothetical protein
MISLIISGFAYIEYFSPADAQNAMKHMDGGQIDGQVRHRNRIKFAEIAEFFCVKFWFDNLQEVQLTPL